MALIRSNTLPILPFLLYAKCVFHRTYPGAEATPETGDAFFVMSQIQMDVVY